MERARAGRAARLLPLLCVAALVAGCSVGPSVRPPVAVRGDAMPAAPGAPQATPTAPTTLPPAEQQNPSFPFYDCTADTAAEVAVPAGRTLRFTCGELTMPADPADPALGLVSIGVLRAGLADAPTNRPPLLVVGDSAGDGSARVAAVLATQVSAELLASYTLVGIDRRGAGYDRLDCAPPDTRAALVDADPDATSEAELTVLLEQARSVVQECNLTLDGSTLGTFRSSSTAADIDRLRIALGLARLTAIGIGDGADALTGWARSRPGYVGRIVLDGPRAPTVDEPELSEARATAAEAAFDAFAVSCTAQPGCPLGAAPRTATTALLQSLRTRPLAAPDGRRLTAGSALVAIRTALGEPRGRPALATAIAAAAAGDPIPLLALLEPVLGPRGWFDGALATACNDTSRRLAPGEISALAGRWRTTYPLFGGSFALGLLDCAPWPTGGARPASGSTRDMPPVLVLGTTADPRGPLEGARRAAQDLPDARFLSWLGAGIGAYPRTPCVSRAVDGIFLAGTLPESDALCPP